MVRRPQASFSLSPERENFVPFAGAWYTRGVMRWIAVVLSVLGGSALADDAPRRLEVTVDATVETDVGLAIGFRCDDPKLVEGSAMKTVDDHNVWMLKGAVAGKTLCRVGTNPTQSSVLFEVVVKDKVTPRSARPR